MTEHTQGPFVAFVKHGVICVHLEKDSPSHFTEVIAWEGFDSCDIESHDEQVANAYLFAAAPDLLEKVRVAVQLASVASDWNLSEVEINGEMVSIYTLINDFNDAISKARAEVT